MRYLRLLAALICTVIVFPSAEAATWAARAVGGAPIEEFKSLIPTRDRGYLGVGQSVFIQGYNFYFRAWVVKMDANGTVKWHKVLSGGWIDSLDSALETSDGYYVIAGEIGHKAYVAKINATGKIKWEWSYPSDNTSAISAIRPVSGGGYIAVGTLYTSSFDAWCLKLDEEGQIVWQQTYGGSETESAYAVQPTTGGGYFVSGDTGSFGGGGDNAWVLKLDSFGKVVWQQTYGGPKNDHSSGLAATSDGGCIIAGSTESFGAGKEDGWIIKLDKSGKIKWQKAVGGREIDVFYSVRQTSDKGYIVAGETESFGMGKADAWALKFSPSGNVVWQYTHGGSKADGLNSILQAADGSYLAGGSTSSFGAGVGDALILRIATTGFVCTPLTKKSSAKITTTRAKGKASAATVVVTAVVPVKPSLSKYNPKASNTLVCSR